MKTQKVQIETIKLDPSNPRSITKEKFEELKKSIKDFPEMEVVKPLIIADDFVIGGNMRLLAYKDLGYREVHVIDVTAWSQAKRDEFMIKDNTHFGSWDYDALANEWDNLPLTEWGVAVWDTEVEDVKGLTDEDEVPEAPEEPITKLGDVWILGEHRVMCGDSTSKEAVEILMDGKKADMVFTDPPYRLKIGGNGAFKKAHDKMGEDLKNLIDFDPTDFLKTLPLVFSKGINAYIFCNTNLVPDYCNWAIKNKFNFNILTWHKTSFIPAGGNHHFPDTEYLIYISKNAIFNSGLNVNYGKYWVLNNEKSKDHPTIKPIEIITNEIKIGSNIKSVIIDLFLGSGSTLIAAEKTKRKCYGMELDPKYCDVIIKRWEDFTGKKATREIDDLQVMTQAH